MENKLLFLINHYGCDNQSMIATEELAELIQALVKYRRKPCEENRKNIIEEIADVEIMLTQLKLIHSCTEEVKAEMNHKINRQVERVYKGE